MAPAIPARYRVVEQIGEGAASIVYRAIRRIDGCEVAMKIHREPRSGAELVAFHREFRILAERPHRSLIRVFDCGVHDGNPFVVMELAKGGDAEALVGDFPAERLRGVAADLLEGLAHLHAQGLVHRDLKPGNLLVGEGSSGPTLRIADLGLSASVDENEASIAGTPGYLAPEYLDGAPPSVRTDLFALGSCLCEFACGHPAFPSSDPVKAMVEAREGPPAIIEQEAPRIPQDIRELIGRLLDPLPARRPASAEAALEMLDGVAGPTGGRLAQPRLVGREEAIEAIRWSLTLSARRRRLYSTYLACEPKSGGTRLISEAATLGRRLGVSVHSIAPAPGEDGHAALARALFTAELDRLDACGGAPVADRATWSTIRGVVQALDSAETPPREGSDGESADIFGLILAFGAVLSELARHRRTLLLVDAPKSAMPLVERLRAAIHGTASEGKLALVTALPRSESVRIVDNGDTHRRVVLAPLDLDGSRRMLESMLHSERLTNEFVSAVHAATQGAPGALEEAVRSLMRTGQLRYDGRWTAELPGARFEVPEAEEGEAVAFPSNLGDVERRAAESLAVLGDATLALLAAVARREVVETGEAVDRLEALGFVVRRHDAMAPWAEPTLHFSSRSTARSLLAELKPVARAVLHGRAADALAAEIERFDRATRPRAHARIAQHLGECGDYHGARNALDASGEGYAALHLYVEEAEALAKFVEAHKERAPSELIEELRLAWGRALDRAGRGSEVGPALEPVLRSDDAWRKASAAARLAKALLGTERIDEARRALEIGVPAVSSLPVGVAGSLRVVLLHRLALVQFSEGDADGCQEVLDETEALLDRIPDGREQRARIQTTRARIDLAKGDRDRAEEKYSAALSVFEEVDDHRRATACEVALGAILYQHSEFAGAARYFHDAADRSRKANDLRGYLVALSNRAVAQSDGGSWAEAAESYRDVLAVAKGIGDLRTRMRTLNNVGLLLRDRGELRRARAMLGEGLDLARTLEDPGAEAILEGNTGELELVEGNPDLARSHFDNAAIGIVAAAPELEGDPLLERPDGIEATRRIAAWEAEYGNLELARAMVVATVGAARRVGAKAELAQLAAVSGLITERSGSDEKALLRYARARRAMELLNLKHAAHRVDIARARLLLKARRHGAARALLEHAMEGLERLGALGDHGEANRVMMEIEDDEPLNREHPRFTPGDHLLKHLLEITLQINAIHELDPLLDLIAQKTVELTGARRAQVFLRSSADDGPQLAASAYREGSEALDGSYSRSFVADVLRSGESLVVTNVADAGEIARRSSIRKLQLRFIIGVPVSDIEGVIGTLYVDDDRAVYDVSREELFVLQSLANQAALAIRNARLFERATVDDLTRVAMRHYFIQRMEEEFHRCRLRHLPLSLLMLDIDHFKLVNDQFGHAAGDEVLAGTAAVIREIIGEAGIVGRLGGEEFAVALSAIDAEQAMIIAEEIRRSVETTLFLPDHRITFSIGVVTLTPEANESLDRLLPAADAALYDAKRRGRNRVVQTDNASIATVE